MDHPHLTHLRGVTYDCKEFANRLWNNMALYAAGLELGVPVSFPSPLQEGRATRRLYELWAQLVGRVLHPKESMWAWGGTVRSLPPTEPLPPKYANAHSLYLLGMLFRNPRGFEKYAVEIRKNFSATGRTQKQVTQLLSSLKGRTLIGVEIRQRPFTYFPSGEFLIPLTRTREMVEEYLHDRALSASDVALVISSDKPVPPELFGAYAHVIAYQDAALSLYALSRASVVIGTNSSHANLAAWLGNVPHVVASLEPIDWSYYRDRTSFFDNTYATLTQKVAIL